MARGRELVIFAPPLAHAVVRGAKTETRRRRGCRYQAGRSYAVQPGRGREAIGRVLVTYVAEERLGDITPASVEAEGFCDLPTFARHWLLLYDPPMRVGGLERVTDEEVLERWRGRFGGETVWVLSLRVDQAAPPRLLHRHSERGYTHSPRAALQDEPEAVEEWALERFGRDARQREERRHQVYEARERTRLAGELDAILLTLSRHRQVLDRRALPGGGDLRLGIIAIKRAEVALRLGTREERHLTKEST